MASKSEFSASALDDTPEDSVLVWVERFRRRIGRYLDDDDRRVDQATDKGHQSRGCM